MALVPVRPLPMNVSTLSGVLRFSREKQLRVTNVLGNTYLGDVVALDDALIIDGIVIPYHAVVEIKVVA
jgi:hypothetical protein